MFKFLQNMFSSAEEEVEPVIMPLKEPRVPEGMRIFVIGDIHGRLDLLLNIHGQINDLLAKNRDFDENVVVYLGDYIDRGGESKGVVDLLLNEPIKGCKSVHLKGNHESEMEDFMVNPKPNHLWTQCGGMETTLSYGVRVKAQVSAVDRIMEMREMLVGAIPDSHRTFFSNLRYTYGVGDYFMVHAGIRPGVPLALQKPEDMCWIRDQFLNHTEPFEKMIIHGHTVVPQPITLPNRIGIDTGAYYTGRLTALVLEGKERRFLSSKADKSPPVDQVKSPAA